MFETKTEVPLDNTSNTRANEGGPSDAEDAALMKRIYADGIDARGAKRSCKNQVIEAPGGVLRGNRRRDG